MEQKKKRLFYFNNLQQHKPFIFKQVEKYCTKIMLLN